MKLLITSVGSLVGQGILDVLECPGRSRRGLVTVIGTNSLADAPNNFRCDRCYLAPQTTADAAFAARMRQILAEESPDLILCGRDEDTLAVSRLKADDPSLPGVLPTGKPEAATIGLDKWQSWLFARKHGLPFAETFMPGVSGDDAALERFCREFGYPLIAKPACGFGSIGVQFVRDADDVRQVVQREGYLLQEYLGDPQPLQAYFAAFEDLPPLFAHAPSTRSVLVDGDHRPDRRDRSFDRAAGPLAFRHGRAACACIRSRARPVHGRVHARDGCRRCGGTDEHECQT